MNHYQVMHFMNEASLNVGSGYGPNDIDDLKEQLAEEQRKAKNHDEACAHKDRYSNPYAREAERLQVIIGFISEGVYVKRTAGGLIEINKKFIVSLANPKWRVKGKNKWYWYSTPKQFVSKYIRRETA